MRTAAVFVILLLILSNGVRRRLHDNAFEYFRTNDVSVGACFEWEPLDAVSNAIWKSSSSLRNVINGIKAGTPSPFWAYPLVSRQPRNMMFLRAQSLNGKAFEHLNCVIGLESVRLDLISKAAIEPSSIRRLNHRIKRLGIRVDASISRDFVAAVADRRTCSVLRLIGTNVDDGALLMLTRCERLDNLEIPEIWTTPEKLRELQQVLPNTAITLIPENIVTSLLHEAQTLKDVEKAED